MSKQLKAKQVKTKIVAKAPVAVDPANKLWLAGLGVVSLAQKQGAAMVDALVGEGRRLQVRGEKTARMLERDMRSLVFARLAPLQQRLDGLRADVALRFERGLGRTLSYAGVPSKSDVDALIKRIDGLSRQLRTSR